MKEHPAIKHVQGMVSDLELAGLAMFRAKKGCKTDSAALRAIIVTGLIAEGILVAKPTSTVMLTLQTEPKQTNKRK